MKKLFIAILEYRVEIEAENEEEANSKLSDILVEKDSKITVRLEDFCIIEDNNF